MLFRLTTLSSSTSQTSHWSTNLVAIDILIFTVPLITSTVWAGMCNTLVVSGVIAQVLVNWEEKLVCIEFY